MPHELFLTARQTTEIRNVFANNTSTDTNLSKIQTFKVNQSDWYFGSD